MRLILWSICLPAAIIAAASGQFGAACYFLLLILAEKIICTD
jgi:hypothetical protein